MNQNDAAKSSREVQLEITMREHLEAAARSRKALRVERLRRELKSARSNVNQLTRQLVTQKALSASETAHLRFELTDKEREHRETHDLLVAVARALGLTGPRGLGDWLADMGAPKASGAAPSFQGLTNMSPKEFLERFPNPNLPKSQESI